MTTVYKTRPDPNPCKGEKDLIKEMLAALKRGHDRDRCYTCSATHNICQRLELIARAEDTLNVSQTSANEGSS